MTDKLREKILKNDRKLLADLDRLGALAPSTREGIERTRQELESKHS